MQFPHGLQHLARAWPIQAEIAGNYHLVAARLLRQVAQNCLQGKLVAVNI